MDKTKSNKGSGDLCNCCYISFLSVSINFGVDLSCVVILFIAVSTDAWNDSAFHTPKAVVIVHCGLPLWAVLL